MQDMSVIISGFGGQGALFAGILLCHSAVFEGKHTTWFPAYGAEMRGGAVNCAVNISDQEVPSPIIDKADAVIALNDASQEKFESKVKPGGFMIVNSSLCHLKPKRTDIKYINIPFNELAQKLTQPAFINVMALGAFIEKTKILKLESIKEVMKEMAKTVSAKKAALLPNNLESVEFGANIIKNQLVTV
mgnify:FL=1